MRRLFGLTVSLTLLIVAAAIANAQGNANVVGTWDMVVDSPQGKRPSTLVIKQEGDKLTAVAKSPRGERPYDSISVKGNEIKMVLTIKFQDQDMVITYTGKVEKDMMKGEADFGGLAQGEWSAVPHKEDAAGAGAGTGTASGGGAGSGMPAENISGVWNFMVEAPQGTGTPVFTFKQDGENLTGTYKGALGEAPLTGTVKGNDVKFSIKVTVQGQALTVAYTGKVEGKDKMKGTVVLGDFGEAKWTAKKQ
jgi:hypothetical protein